MELLMALFLNFLGLLPAIAITVIAFIIIPILGVGISLFFLVIAVCTAIHTVSKLKKNKR